MEKNYSKYNSYRNAFDQINAAIGAGFFLEAITIEESMLTDRLLRFCREKGFSKRAEKATLGNELIFLKERPEGILQSEEIDFIPELDHFWSGRNQCLHQIAKSEPGMPTLDFEELIELAKKTAIEGRTLVNKVGKWAEKYKGRLLKSTEKK